MSTSWYNYAGIMRLRHCNNYSSYRGIVNTGRVSQYDVCGCYHLYRHNRLSLPLRYYNCISIVTTASIRVATFINIVIDSNSNFQPSQSFSASLSISMCIRSQYVGCHSIRKRQWRQAENLFNNKASVSNSSQIQHRRTSFERTNSSLDVQWCAGQEECPPPFLLANLAESFKIPHLANGSAPFSEKPLVQTPACRVESMSQQKVVLDCRLNILPVSIGGGHASNATVSPATAAKWWSYSHRTVASLFCSPIAWLLFCVPFWRSSGGAKLCHRTYLWSDQFVLEIIPGRSCQDLPAANAQNVALT
jgi:hypothetical protein